MDKITITREDVKKVVGFMAQCGTAWTVGSMMGVFGPHKKVFRILGALGASAISVRLMDPVQEGADRMVDSWCDIFGLVKDKIEVKETFEDTEE